MSDDTQETSMHDCLALGELSSALETPKSQPAQDTVPDDHRRHEELQRLPLFMRLLSASRLLSSIPSLHESRKTEDEASDSFIDEVVSRLEEVGATHSSAEDVDILTTHYAPKVCRKMAKSLSLAKPRKKRRVESGSADVSRPSDVVDEDLEMKEEEDLDEDLSEKMSMDEDVSKAPGDQSAVLEDAQETRVANILTELSDLVAKSLKPVSEGDDDDEGASSRKAALILPADSLLAEERPSRAGVSTSTSGGIMGGADLGSTLAAIMHHVPALRYRQVSSALCRAAIPQAASLISQLGANCPSAISCLLRGCLDAYRLWGADQQGVVAAVRASILAISKVSLREACRVRSMLQCEQVMVDMQLELALEQSSIDVACLLTDNFAQQLQDYYKSNDATGSSTPKPDDTNKGPTEESLACNIMSLFHSLCTNLSLAEKTVACLLDALGSNHTTSLGESCLYLRSLSWSLFRIGDTWANLCSDGKVATALSHIGTKLFAKAPTSRDPASVHDECYKLLVCCSLITCSCSILDDGGGTESCNVFQEIMNFEPPSVHCLVFRSRLALLLHLERIGSIRLLVFDSLSQKSRESFDVDDREAASRTGEGYIKMCKWAQGELGLTRFISAGMSRDVAIVDPSALLLSLDSGTAKDSDFVDTLRDILYDSKRCRQAMEANGIADFVTGTVALAAEQSRNGLPLVLPLQLLALCAKMHWPRRGDDLEDVECQLLLQLLYCLSFLDHVAESPFKIDARQLPLAEIYAFCSSQSDPRLDGLPGVKSWLKELIRMGAPEVTDVSFVDVNSAFSSAEHSSQDNITALQNVIRCAMDSDGVDFSGEHAESLFVQLQTQVDSNTIFEACACAMLSSPHEPLPFVTYGALVRDPLVLLKCNLRVWKNGGLRRIALVILWSAMAVQRHVAHASPHAESANELLASRDAIVARTLLLFSCGGTAAVNERSITLQPIYCPLMTDMIRSLVASQPGIVAMLLRQGLDEKAVDWLIEFVPESFRDAPALTQLLTQRQLSVSERLTASDASLRIAIAHGWQDEAAAASLAAAALNALVSSFFLVLGPIGLPVTVVCEDGRDINKLCRKATFRMLRALQSVDASRPMVRTECAKNLQRLAALCKGEINLPGAIGKVATGRKKLVKEIFDAVNEAGSVMGVAISI